MEEWVERYILDAVGRIENRGRVRTGFDILTHSQAMTLVKIIIWASLHDDCDVTQDEAKDLCRAIQYISSTCPKEEAEG